MNCVGICGFEDLNSIVLCLMDVGFLPLIFLVMQVYLMQEYQLYLICLGIQEGYPIPRIFCRIARIYWIRVWGITEVCLKCRSLYLCVNNSPKKNEWYGPSMGLSYVFNVCTNLTSFVLTNLKMLLVFVSMKTRDKLRLRHWNGSKTSELWNRVYIPAKIQYFWNIPYFFSFMGKKSVHWVYWRVTRPL